METVGLGFCLEDLPVGRQFKTVGRTITEADIVNFINTTGMVEVLFTNLEFLKHESAIKGRVSPGALVFCLAHAPGLWLRGAGAIEGLGTAPSLPLSIAYSVTTMGLAGLVFGILWMRTRNWLLLVVLHGMADALSSTPDFMATWRL